jgi:hypothetical protein
MREYERRSGVRVSVVYDTDETKSTGLADPAGRREGAPAGGRLISGRRFWRLPAASVIDQPGTQSQLADHGRFELSLFKSKCSDHRLDRFRHQPCENDRVGRKYGRVTSIPVRTAATAAASFDHFGVGCSCGDPALAGRARLVHLRGLSVIDAGSRQLPMVAGTESAVVLQRRSEHPLEPRSAGLTAFSQENDVPKPPKPWPHPVPRPSPPEPPTVPLPDPKPTPPIPPTPTALIPYSTCQFLNFWRGDP